MKIGIIGDPHFGAGLVMGKTDPATQLNTRLLDIANTFDGIIDTFIEQKVDVVVVTGDVFESRYPTPAQLNMFSKCIKRATVSGLKVIIIAGNHDQQRTIDTTTIDVFGLLEVPNVFTYNKMDYVNIGKDVNLILMPYRDKRMIDAETNNDAVLKIEAELQSLMSKIKGKKIVVGHFMFGKPIKGISLDAFSINELVLPLSIFDGADAVVMGHIHKNQILCRDPLMLYVGSMDKKDFGEKDNNNISVIIDTNDINNPTIIKNDTRSLLEIDLDYSKGQKAYKGKITETIISDIDTYGKKNNITESIIKVSILVKEGDLFYINEELIKKHILSNNVRYLIPIHIRSINKRVLRNKNITEDISETKAIVEYINGLRVKDGMKKKLIKFAKNIINEVNGI